MHKTITLREIVLLAIFIGGCLAILCLPSHEEPLSLWLYELILSKAIALCCFIVFFGALKSINEEEKESEEERP